MENKIVSNSEDVYAVANLVVNMLKTPEIKEYLNLNHKNKCDTSYLG